MDGDSDGATMAADGVSAFKRRLPNALTISRVVMTVAFVAVLSLYRFPDVNAWAIPTALILFVVAALTDALDGYLARKWNVVSVFGRIVDPLADKVLVLGAFIMLAGPGFTQHDNFVWVTISGVVPWMVVVILARELLVTTMRAAFEGRGVDFSAVLAGKIKMIVQSVGVPLILLVVIGAERSYDNPFPRFEARLPELRQRSLEAWDDKESIEEFAAEGSALSDQLREEVKGLEPGALTEGAARVERIAVLASFIAWAVTLVTVASVVPYVSRAVRGSEGVDG